MPKHESKVEAGRNFPDDVSLSFELQRRDVEESNVKLIA